MQTLYLVYDKMGLHSIFSYNFEDFHREMKSLVPPQFNVESRCSLYLFLKDCIEIDDRISSEILFHACTPRYEIQS